MWRELISDLFDDVEFGKPASPGEIERVEAAFGLSLPADLRDFLSESNGVAAHYGTRLVWSTNEMLEQNQLFRKSVGFTELYMPFDCLLFFGEDGSGDQFAYRVLAGQVRDSSWIFRWDHESDNREWFAGQLDEYLRRSVPTGE